MDITIVSQTTEARANEEIIQQNLEILVTPTMTKTNILVVENTPSPSASPSATSATASEVISAAIGDVAATDVQSAIAELASEKARKSYIRTFTHADLDVANLLVVNHQLGITPASVFIWDNNGNVVLPDEIIRNNLNILYINFTSFIPLSGTYQVVISE